MQGEEKQYWVLWNQIPQVGARRIARLLETFGSLSAAWRASVADLALVLGDPLARRVDQQRSTGDRPSECVRARQLGVTILTWDDEEYPLLLREIPDPPPVLYRRGEPAPTDLLAVAIVGTRRASVAGCRLARQIAAGLAELGVTVVSGLALGIDGQAHAAALQAGGRSVAVLGCGVDVFYPPEHVPLQRELIRRGCLYSPYPLGTPPHGPNFIARNRIISGLSWGTVVVEAGARSGALVTAAFACQQNRDVCAVPGDPGRTGSQGCNRLIREGAAPVTSWEEVVEELNLRRLFRSLSSWSSEPSANGSSTAESPDRRAASPSSARRRPAFSRSAARARSGGEPDLPGVKPAAMAQLREALRREEMTVDQIQSYLSLPIGLVQRLLVELELRGGLVRTEGGRYRWL